MNQLSLVRGSMGPVEIWLPSLLFPWAGELPHRGVPQFPLLGFCVISGAHHETATFRDVTPVIVKLDEKVLGRFENTLEILGRTAASLSI